MLNQLLNLGTRQSWYGSSGSQGATLHVETKPWWCYVLEYIADRGCLPLHYIPLPKWPRYFDRELEEWTSLGEGWGDLGCVWDCLVLNNVWKLTWKFTKDFGIPLTAEQVEQFPFHDTRIWWMQNHQNHLEWEAKEVQRESRDKAQS